MPRGKNYVNGNRGVTMLSSNKKKAPSMEQCFYGKGCTRKDCIYKHDKPGPGGGEKSNEPCMPFLAGQCAFTAGGCRKRHPNKEETDRLVAKYKKTKCRFGKDCKTAGCLYIHPSDNDRDLGGAAFPPLSGSISALRPVPPMPPSGAWKPAQSTGAMLAMSSPGGAFTGPNQVSQPAVIATAGATAPPPKSAWQPSPPQQRVPVWGKGKNLVLATHSNPPSLASNGRTSNGLTATVTPNQKPLAAPKTPVMSFADAASPSQPDSSDFSLNIHAREFVPGNF